MVEDGVATGDSVTGAGVMVGDGVAVGDFVTGAGIVVEDGAAVGDFVAGAGVMVVGAVAVGNSTGVGDTEGVAVVVAVGAAPVTVRLVLPVDGRLVSTRSPWETRTVHSIAI